MNAETNSFIAGYIRKQYGPSFPLGEIPKGICWDFCQEVHSMEGKELPNIVVAKDVLQRVESPVVLDIVLFKFGEMFHGGIIWPDGLHFVHAVPVQEKETRFIIERGRVTAFPWNNTIEGFYHVL